MKNDFIYKAISILEDITDIPVYIESIRKDTDIMLTIGGEMFYGFARKTGRRTNLSIALPFIEQEISKNRIIIADYLTRKTAEYLKENSINYIDTVGNVFIKTKNIFVFTYADVTGYKKTASRTKAFHEAGLKLILLLISNPESINFSFRKLAEMAGVSLGSVSNIFDDLEKNNFILRSNYKRVLKNKKELIERWVIAYNDVLKPRITKRKLRAAGVSFSTQQILNLKSKNPIYLGGEPGAQLLTNYLIPKHYIIFSDEDFAYIGKELRLIPDEEGEIELLSPFWSNKINLKNEFVAPPLVVYADLLNSGVIRNLEAAKIILENEL